MYMPVKRDEASWLLDLLVEPMQGVRQRRKFIENEWLLNYRAWQGWPSQNYMLPLPDGAIHYFIPHARRAIERNVARTVQLEMPERDWFNCAPTDNISHDNAEAVIATMDYIYRKKIKTKRVISSLARCMQLYNFAVLSTSISIQRNEVWPVQKDEDPFSFYVFPDTAPCADEATLIFQDVIVPYQVYYSYVDRDNPEQSLYKYIPVDDLHTPEWPYHLIERLAYRGLASPSSFMQGTGSIKSLTSENIAEHFKQTNEALNKQARQFVALSKCHFRVQSNWYYAIICTNTKKPCLVRLDDVENTPTVQWANSRPLPGELYTNAPTDDIRVLQNLANTAISQVESNRTRFAEPPIGVDLSEMGRIEAKTFANRELWYFSGDPNAMMKEMLVNDTSNNGIKAYQIYLQMIQALAGGGSVAEGNPGRNMPRAGFAVDNLINLSLADTLDGAGTIEQELLTPGLADTYHNLVEYVPASQILKIPGKANKAPQVFNKADLMGDYSFTWLGAQAFQDQAKRAETFMGLLQTLLNPEVMQLLAQQNAAINFPYLLRYILASGLGERGIGDIFMPVPQQQTAQMQNAQQTQQQIQQLQMQIQQAEEQRKQQETANKTVHTKAQIAKIDSEIQSARIDDAVKVHDARLRSMQPVGTNGVHK